MTSSTDLTALAQQLGQQLGSPEALLSFTKLLQKHRLEAALNAEMETHLEATKPRKKDSRNGYSRKTLKTADDCFERDTPRDRQGDFEPHIVKKRQTRVESIDNTILSLYTKGMSTREIAELMKERYDADVSPLLISRVTDATLLTGTHVLWTASTRSFISTALWSRSARISGSSTRLSTLPWVLIWKARKTC